MRTIRLVAVLVLVASGCSTSEGPSVSTPADDQPSNETLLLRCDDLAQSDDYKRIEISALADGSWRLNEVFRLDITKARALSTEEQTSLDIALANYMNYDIARRLLKIDAARIAESDGSLLEDDLGKWAIKFSCGAYDVLACEDHLPR